MDKKSFERAISRHYRQAGKAGALVMYASNPDFFTAVIQEGTGNRSTLKVLEATTDPRDTNLTVSPVGANSRGVTRASNYWFVDAPETNTVLGIRNDQAPQSLQGFFINGERTAGLTHPDIQDIPLRTK